MRKFLIGGHKLNQHLMGVKKVLGLKLNVYTNYFHHGNAIQL